MDEIKILFLAANPDNTARLRLDKEAKTIKNEIIHAQYYRKGRENFILEPELAVKVTEFSRHLVGVKPTIVHFSGHGSEEGQICLEDANGNICPVDVQTTSRLFSRLKDTVRCVVLNACYSEKQAKAISEHIDCVIGMSKSIRDDAAIAFAQGFYRGILNGTDIETAFGLGRDQVELLKLAGQDTPKIVWKNGKPQTIVFGQQQKPKMNFAPIKKLTWKNAEQAAYDMAWKMKYDRFIPSLIVGMGRGGAIMGALISEHMGKIPLLAIDRKHVWKKGEKIDSLLLRFRLPAKYLDCVLLVTGEVHTGTTMRLYYDYLLKIGAKEVRCATFYLQKRADYRVKIDYSGEEYSKEFLMPWV